MKKKALNRKIDFVDYPDFRPNLTPEEMFRAGVFGGTYWRPIHSSITNKSYKNPHLKFPKSWWNGIDSEKYLVSKKCNPKINKYGVASGTSLQMWEEKGWITPTDPYGWVQWYCNFYLGRRTDDDRRQINRWSGIAGDKGRFRNRLISMCHKKGKSFDDITVSPVIRQLLLQWAYELTEQDFEDYLSSF